MAIHFNLICAFRQLRKVATKPNYISVASSTEQKLRLRFAGNCKPMVLNESLEGLKSRILHMSGEGGNLDEYNSVVMEFESMKNSVEVDIQLLNALTELIDRASESTKQKILQANEQTEIRTRLNGAKSKLDRFHSILCDYLKDKNVRREANRKDDSVFELASKIEEALNDFDSASVYYYRD